MVVGAPLLRQKGLQHSALIATLLRGKPVMSLRQKSVTKVLGCSAKAGQESGAAREKENSTHFVQLHLT